MKINDRPKDYAKVIKNRKVSKSDKTSTYKMSQISKEKKTHD